MEIEQILTTIFDIVGKSLYFILHYFWPDFNLNLSSTEYSHPD